MEAECTENDVPGNSSASITRLGKCEVCGWSEAKYTCPRCEVKTCCLKCVNIHKEELECTGARDRTKFITMNKFSNLDLSSDYRLLEEITRNVESLKKNRGRMQKKGQEELPSYLHKLRKAANLRKIKLKFLPRNFERRKNNTTYWDAKSNVIFWHIDWIFANANNLKLSDDVPETAKLNHLLHKYLVEQDNELLQQKLQYYRAADLPGLKIFLQAEQKAGCKYYELDRFESLKDNLKNKVIIEHPIIHVVLKEHTSSYSVLDSDDENEEVEIRNGKDVVDRIIEKAEKDDTVHNSLKNLLFISEQSEEEM